MNFLALAGGLCRHYGWAPDFWRGMPWRTFRAWLRQARADLEAETGPGDPTTWKGGDGWFAASHRRARGQVAA